MMEEFIEKFIQLGEWSKASFLFVLELFLKGATRIFWLNSLLFVAL